jgi:predicted nucleic acid-binding protein
MLVIDASVAVKFVTEEPGSAEAYDIIIGPDPLIAPDWVLAECANALGKKVLNDQLSRNRAETSFAELPRFFIRLFGTGSLLEAGFRLALDINYAVYDCLYLALALREEATMITADAKFAKAARRGGFAAQVRVLGGQEGCE